MLRHRGYPPCVCALSKLFRSPPSSPHPSNSATRFHRVINFQDEPRDHRQRRNGVGKTLTTLADSGTSRKRLFREISRREPASLFKLQHSPALNRVLLICHVSSSLNFHPAMRILRFTWWLELKNDIFFSFKKRLKQCKSKLEKKIIIEINFRYV